MASYTSREVSDRLCACGCGGYTLLIPKSDPAAGRVRGEPNTYITGHNGKRTSPEVRREQMRAAARRFYVRHGARIRAEVKAYRDANRDKAREQQLRWEAENIEHVRDRRRIRQARRRARRVAAFVEDVHPLVVLERDDGVCGICGEDVDPLDFHVDHIVPLCQGGRHAYDNAQATHPACNIFKGGRVAA